MKYSLSFRTWDLNCFIFPGTDQMFEEQRPVVVHGRWIAEEQGCFSLSTNVSLVDYKSGYRSTLLYAEGLEDNIFLLKDQAVDFILYFEPLPEKCSAFFVTEGIKKVNPVGSEKIHRNGRDEYFVVLEEQPL